MREPLAIAVGIRLGEIAFEKAEEAREAQSGSILSLLALARERCRCRSAPDFRPFGRAIRSLPERGIAVENQVLYAAGNFSNGVARSKPCANAASSSVSLQIAEPAPGPSPPSKSGRDQSTITFAGSKSYFEPRPLHAGQAP